MRVIHSVGIACFVSASTLFPSLVSAAPILYARVQVSAQNQDVVGFPVDSDDSGQINNVDTIAPLSAAIGLASSSAFVTDGVMGADATAGSLGSGGINGQTAMGNALFVDTLTLISSSLSVGTSVSLQAFLGLSATTTGPSDPFLGCGQANGTLSKSVPGGFVMVASAQETNCVGSTDFNNVGTITAAIGDDVTVQAQLIATAYGRAGGEGSVDATLRMFLIPIGDFSYTTLSGNSYLRATTPAPVPEPGALSLFALGLAGAASRRFRTRK